MSDFKTRLQGEHQELLERIQKLEQFIYSDQFYETTPKQQSLLRFQLTAMLSYSSCLRERIIDLY